MKFRLIQQQISPNAQSPIRVVEQNGKREAVFFNKRGRSFLVILGNADNRHSLRPVRFVNAVYKGHRVLANRTGNLEKHCQNRTPAQGVLQ